MTAEQVAAFDIQLYLDTHPNDKNALHMFNKYQEEYAERRKQYEALYGQISADSMTNNVTWEWINNPWPWEVEAN
jgi:spore coat protein JB